jgi:hypothetical protein
MNKLTSNISIILLIITASTVIKAQNVDSFFVFKDPKNIIIDSTVYKKAWGFDIFASDNGFGLGSFYRYQYTNDLYGVLSLAISESKDQNEMEYIDYWGNKYTIGKKNRILMFPVTAGIQYRLFREQIVETFKPYVAFGVGPVLLYTTPYDREFFNALRYGQAHYTLGGYVGLGADFGIDKKNLMGVNIRYYFIPYPAGLESLNDKPMKYFGGVYINLNFGIQY